MPDALLGVINPAMRPVFKFQNVRPRLFTGAEPCSLHSEKSCLPATLTARQEVKTQIVKIMTGENEVHKTVSHKTVFSSLLASDLPPQELSVARMQQEAAGIIGAGIETTKSTLSLASFHILDNPVIFRRLRQELEEVFPDPAKPPSLAELERLPYLTAVIQEGTFVSLPSVLPLPIQLDHLTNRPSPQSPAPLLRCGPTTTPNLAPHLHPLQ
jgi:Cytochrome P450